MQDEIAGLIPRLRRYARALASARMASDELLRRTLERASAQLRVEHAQSELRVWLFSLLHETYLEALAPQDAEQAAAESAGAPSGPAPFQQAIATLPPLQREIFLLVTLEDMSYEQVAKALDIPIGTVMSRLSRAREKLRLLLMHQARVRAAK